jgi:hypothetical protein
MQKRGFDTILEMNRTHIIYSMVDMLERLITVLLRLDWSTWGPHPPRFIANRPYPPNNVILNTWWKKNGIQELTQFHFAIWKNTPIIVEHELLVSWFGIMSHWYHWFHFSHCSTWLTTINHMTHFKKLPIFLQCEAPKIAKLVYNSNNYGLWYL